MKKIVNYFRHRRDVSLLAAALLLLVVALFNPTIPLKRNIYSYILVVDISQSMNVMDASLNGKPTSRIAYTQYMLHRIIGEMPCGTNVSIGIFAGVSISAMYTPIEVCDNFDAIEDTIDHLDWRNAWSGNTRLREGVLTLARVIRGFPEPAQVVYFTDGEEAPKLHAFNTRDLTGFQGADGWLYVGVGSEKGASIPKLDEKNQLIGYWSNESFALQPGIAQISEQNIGTRDDNVAGDTNDRFISKLDETYLKSMTKEIGADYVRGDSLQNVLSAMKAQKPARRDVAPFGIKWILASFAGLLFIAAYMPKHPIHELTENYNIWLARRKARNAANGFS